MEWERALRSYNEARLYTNVYNRPAPDSSLISCPHCDLLQNLPPLELGGAACCLRCGIELWHRREDGLRRTLALSLASAMLYVIAIAVPMIGLTIVGRSASATVVGGAEFLWDDNGLKPVGVLVLFTAVIAPALQIGFMLAIALGARRNPPPRWVGVLLRHHPTTRTWSMIEVMLLGVLVALIKIADYATVVPGAALFVLAGLVVLLAATQVSFDPREVWERIEWADGESRSATTAPAQVEARE
jgi:paraquat-inducible protein A